MFVQFSAKHGLQKFVVLWCHYMPSLIKQTKYTHWGRETKNVLFLRGVNCCTRPLCAGCMRSNLLIFRSSLNPIWHRSAGARCASIYRDLALRWINMIRILRQYICTLGERHTAAVWQRRIAPSLSLNRRHSIALCRLLCLSLECVHIDPMSVVLT